MRERFREVLEEVDSDASDERWEALGRFWPQAKKLSRSKPGVVVDLTAWAARRSSPAKRK